MTPYAVDIDTYTRSLKIYIDKCKRYFASWRRLLTGPAPAGCIGPPDLAIDADDYSNSLLISLEGRTNDEVYNYALALHQKVVNLHNIVQAGKYCYGGDANCCWAL